MGRRLRLLPVGAADVLRRQPATRRRRFKEAFRRLAEDPTGVGTGMDVRVLDTDDNLPRILRLRLGDWRAAFVVEAREVVILRVFHRSEGYAWMDELDL